MNRTHVAITALALSGFTAGLTGCDLPTAEANSPCSDEGSYAQDATYLLKCEGGTWRTGITVAAGNQALELLKTKFQRDAKMRGNWSNCTEVRDAGVAPLYQGERGYSTKLDRDRDGIACEVE